MCEKLIDHNKKPLIHIHQNNKIIYFVPEPVDEEDAKEAKEVLKGEKEENVFFLTTQRNFIKTLDDILYS